MQCPKCGFLMSAFDEDCPRCKNLETSQPIQTPPVSQPITSTQPTSSQPATATNTSAPNLISTSSLSNPQHKLIAFCVAAGVFFLGYFSPWVTFSVLGANLSISGSSYGSNVWMLLIIIAATGVGIYEFTQQTTNVLNIVKLSLCAGAAAGTAYRISYIVGTSYGLGYGMILMLIASCFMFYIALIDLPKQRQMRVIITEAVIFCAIIIFGGISGNSQKVDTTNLFNGNTSLFQNSQSDDVTTHFISSSEISSLQPTSDIFQATTPDLGKKFVICTITVTYTGTSGSLPVAPSNFQLTASNNQLYGGSDTTMGNYQNYKPIQATLLTNGSVTGDVLFVMDENATPEQIQYVSGF